MPAATVASSDQTVFGNKRIAIYSITALADTNTLATGFQRIDWFGVTPETGIACGGTVSGGTITFAVASTTPNARVIVVGV